MARRLDARAPEFAAQFEALLHNKRQGHEDVAETVRAIIAKVRATGDETLVELSNSLDRSGVTQSTLRLTQGEIDHGASQCSVELIGALELAAERIENYHRRQLPKDAWFVDAIGAELGWRWTPIDRVGLYVPGGTAAYPSSVLMNGLPAKIAGVGTVAMVTPATNGVINPLVLAAAKRAGINEIYRVGGAQAVAALAFGTKSIAPVDKIVGPGNAYVAAAKREVYGQVGIDSIAGPSEILVVADDANSADWIAADLLSQAEHDVCSQCVLITDSSEFANKVERALEQALALLPRRDIAQRSWHDYGAVIVVPNLLDAAKLVDAMAPEHLEIATAKPELISNRVRHAGAIFLGRHTPEAMGDYIAGPNHVLPTSRTARFSSGLSVLDFMKRTTLLSLAPHAIAKIGPDAMALAQAEGLDGHAHSIAARLNFGS